MMKVLLQKVVYSNILKIVLVIVCENTFLKELQRKKNSSSLINMST